MLGVLVDRVAIVGATALAGEASGVDAAAPPLVGTAVRDSTIARASGVAGGPSGAAVAAVRAGADAVGPHPASDTTMIIPSRRRGDACMVALPSHDAQRPITRLNPASDPDGRALHHDAPACSRLRPCRPTPVSRARRAETSRSLARSPNSRQGAPRDLPDPSSAVGRVPGD